MRVSRMLASASILVAACGLSACGAETSVDTGEDSASAAKATSSVARIEKAFAGVSYDFDRITRSQLLRQSTAVVLGRVSKIVNGRVRGESINDPFSLRRAAMQVEIVSVSKGAALGSDVWVELPVTREQASSGVKVGMMTALFLTPTSVDGKAGSFTEGAEYPSDAILWRPTNAQGLIFAYDEQLGTISPLSDDLQPSETIASTISTASD